MDCAVHASDGEVGAVKDFPFDDRDLEIRWVTVDAGRWLPGRTGVHRSVGDCAAHGCRRSRAPDDEPGEPLYAHRQPNQGANRNGSSRPGQPTP